MSVCANLNQCLAVLMGSMLFDVKLGFLNGYGMMVTLVGAALYNKVQLDWEGRVEVGVAKEEK